MIRNISQCEKRIGYRFKDKNILLQALTHSSYAYENQQNVGSDNETLEFLGDSVLGLIVADYLYSAYSELSEGELSKLKSTAAKKTILAGAFEALVAAIYLDSGLKAAKTFLIPQLEFIFRKIRAESYLINNYKSALQESLQKKNLPAPVYRTVTTTGPDHKKSFIVEVFLEKRPLAKAKGSSKKNAEQSAAQKALKGIHGKKIKVFTSDTFLMKKRK
jgi:ribonuclease-3